MAGPKDQAVYAAVYKSLREKIFFGQLKPGDILPSESKLCSEFHASRETVRKGLKQLVSEGLIYAKSKVGYFVAQPNHRQFSLAYTPELDECKVNYLDIHGTLPDALIQRKLGVPADRKVIVMTQGYLTDSGDVVAIEIKYIPYVRAYPSVEGEIRFAVLPDITFSKLSSYEYYTSVEVSAVLANSFLAEKMHCDVGEPLLMMERTIFCQDGTCAAYSRSYGKSGYGRLLGTSGQKI